MASAPNSTYGWLLKIHQQIESLGNPTTGEKMLRMQVLDGRSRDEIAGHFNTTKRCADPAISVALTKIIDKLDVPRDPDLRRQLVYSLKRFDVHKNLLPWQEWFNLWKNFPTEIAPPPTITGILNQEIWGPMGLGENQASRGRAQTQPAQRPPSRTAQPAEKRHRFTVEPFTRDGFVGLKITPEQAEHLQTPPVKNLAIAVHADLVRHEHSNVKNRLSAEDNRSLFCPASSSVEFNQSGKARALLLKIPDPNRPHERALSDAYSKRGALTLLTLGYGPINVDALCDERVIYTKTITVPTGQATKVQASLDPFSNGITKTPPPTLSLPPSLTTAGFTSYSFGVPEAALRVLMKRHTLCGADLTIFGHKRLPDGSSYREIVGTLSLLSATRDAIDVSVQGYGKWHDTNTRWVRATEIGPQFSTLLERGEGQLPCIDPINIPKPSTGKQLRVVQFAGHAFVIPATYTKPRTTLEVYLTKPGKGTPPRVFATFLPHSNKDQPLLQEKPVTVYASEVGAVPEGSRRKWKRVDAEEWEKIKNTITRISA
jgi:hypothetical protein